MMVPILPHPANILHADGQKVATQDFAPMSGYAFTANGGTHYIRTQNWSWTPAKDGVQMVQFVVETSNYTDVNKANNVYIHVVNVTQSTNLCIDFLDAGNTASETAGVHTVSGGLTGLTSETIGNVTETFDYRYLTNINDEFTIRLANQSGTYNTLQLREQHLTETSNYRDVLNNPDQSGGGDMALDASLSTYAQGQTFTTGPYTTYIQSIAVMVKKVGLLKATSQGIKLTLKLYESRFKYKVLGSVTRNLVDIQAGQHHLTDMQRTRGICYVFKMISRTLRKALRNGNAARVPHLMIHGVLRAVNTAVLRVLRHPV